MTILLPGTDHFYDKNVSHICILNKPDRNGWQYSFAKNFVEREQYIFIVYMLHVCFGIPKKTLPVSQLNSLKQRQNLDPHHSNQKKEKEKKYRRKYSVNNFWKHMQSNTCNLPKPLDLAQGKFMDTEHDHN